MCELANELDILILSKVMQDEALISEVLFEKCTLGKRLLTFCPITFIRIRL